MGANEVAVATRNDAPAFEPVLESGDREEGISRPSADPRVIALALITALLALFALRIAAAFLIPLLLSVFLSYTLSPLVGKLSRGGLPRPIGAALAIALVIALLAGAAYRVGNDAADVLQQIPEAVQRLRLSVARANQDHSGALEHVQRAATELEALANATAPAGTATSATTTPHASTIDIQSLLLLGTGSAVIALGQLGSALFLAFFLLSAGDLFRRKLVRAVGPSLSRRRTTLTILKDVNRLNQRYFAVVLFVNLAVGTVTWAGFYGIGLDRPLVWGIAAAVLHTIPYLGAAMLAGAAALIAYGQFGTLDVALLAAAVPLMAAGVLGVGLQTWLMGRAARMNAAAIFVSLLFWSMVWGGWGLLLGVPIMVAVKTVCDHVDRLKPYGTMLGP